MAVQTSFRHSASPTTQVRTKAHADDEFLQTRLDKDTRALAATIFSVNEVMKNYSVIENLMSSADAFHQKAKIAYTPSQYQLATHINSGLSTAAKMVAPYSFNIRTPIEDAVRNIPDNQRLACTLSLSEARDAIRLLFIQALDTGMQLYGDAEYVKGAREIYSNLGAPMPASPFRTAKTSAPTPNEP